MSPVLKSTWLALVGFAFGVAPAGAQRLSFAPQIGFYIPTENLHEAASGGEFKLEGGPSIGARIGLWFGSRFGIEASGAYVPTTFKLENGNQEITSQDARLFTGSGTAVFFILPRTFPLSVFVNGGVGVISRGGVAFTSEAETSDLSGVFGGGVGINLGGLSLVAGADLFRYTATYSGTQATSSEVTQLDISLRLGFGFGMGR